MPKSEVHMSVCQHEQVGNQEPPKVKKGSKKTKRRGKVSKRRAQKTTKQVVDILSPAAMENLQYIAHNAPAALSFRGFPWKGKKLLTCPYGQLIKSFVDWSDDIRVGMTRVTETLMDVICASESFVQDIRLKGDSVAKDGDHGNLFHSEDFHHYPRPKRITTFGYLNPTDVTTKESSVRLYKKIHLLSPNATTNQSTKRRESGGPG
ncbi:hypothetical protein T265_02056 [Opisthorchis viverrini]|uniref:Uncharacterized protein n=1 Tax=Opisthorchis viverrini TaxID=6198 RepID=A0A075AIL2_OPIVI|nr:hypothetical protein T265_02056 [Opisthorchis viverrini]KER31829.1 hypothetical protein T265_02056 [Opisthorchis viverrini]